MEKKRGRPRDENVRAAIHRAARDLLVEHGYGRLTIDGIARRAGVGRQTVYRWWHTKADVVLEAIGAQADLEIPADDLATFLRATFTVAPEYVPVLSGLMAEAQLDPGFAARFRTDFLDRRRATLTTLVRRELPAADPELAADLVFGTLWYLVLTRPDRLGPEYAEWLLARLDVSPP
ncbi:TetR/AcrR family transcriptional regulator [Actinocatenispora rupis]|uniref:TetR family transcriptional regulator n=1 Tax=Actinocatenispora rupis TaxID=519421 RepID=A0A8J3JA77_9ACTN|nr:TetR/AcrR family transcriptional regulator [Actinocatenispora rupis]GID12939.1 TetR family transcriptional regulator [Actinocatenispora rupis]